MLECIYVTRSDRRGWSLTLNTHFHVYTVSWENNYRCGWLIGSESSSEADVIAAAVIVTLLEMPHDSPGFPSNSCAFAKPWKQNTKQDHLFVLQIGPFKIPSEVIPLWVLAVPRVGSRGVFQTGEPCPAWVDTNLKPIRFEPCVPHVCSA